MERVPPGQPGHWSLSLGNCLCTDAPAPPVDLRDSTPTLSGILSVPGRYPGAGPGIAVHHSLKVVFRQLSIVFPPFYSENVKPTEKLKENVKWAWLPLWHAYCLCYSVYNKSTYFVFLLNLLKVSCRHHMTTYPWCFIPKDFNMYLQRTFLLQSHSTIILNTYYSKSASFKRKRQHNLGKIILLEIGIHSFCRSVMQVVCIL